jgi:D-alanyl-D-alanine carboxypeptidase/D-alanyl-D-alanine-endopeptidase (penicillin-binding protein 4)
VSEQERDFAARSLFSEVMRRLALLATALAVAAPAATVGATAHAAPLDAALARQLALGGGVNGAYALDVTTGRVLGAVRADTARIPASVEKLYTSATALLQLGADATLDTQVLGRGTLTGAGVWRGDLYLRGSGDPTFGSSGFTQYDGEVGTTVDALAQAVADAGITRVSGRVYGDESLFDLRRGGPSTNWSYDVWIGGPLSALLYNRGLAKENGSALAKQPAQFAAQQLTTALKRAGVAVARPAALGSAPQAAEQLASVSSPPLSRIVKLTLVPSDNLFAEQLLKIVGAKADGVGTTTGGTRVVKQTLKRFGISPRIADGSGLSRADATTPRQVVTLLDGMREQQGFRSGLPVAGRSGTLAKRMRGTVAQDRCQAKTGTLSNVSALAGYCTTTNGHTIAFAVMFNSVSTYSAKAAEDRIAQLLARQKPAGAVRASKPATRATRTTSAPAGRSPGGVSASAR